MKGNINELEQKNWGVITHNDAWVELTYKEAISLVNYLLIRLGESFGRVATICTNAAANKMLNSVIAGGGRPNAS